MNHSKILMVGNLNETLYSLSEYLMADFQIQMCSDSVDNVKDMLRLFKPSVVLVLADELNDNLKDILELVEKKHNPFPLLVIGTTEMRSELRELLYNYGNKSIMYRPVVSSAVRKECMILLNVAIRESGDEESEQVRKRILIVDDNALVLRNTKSLLEKDYDISLANSGIKALSILKANKIDLVLLDYDMPVMNGREVFEQIISDENTMNIPVVFLTSVAEREQIYAVLKNKPFGYILKPPANDKIINVIKEALG